MLVAPTVFFAALLGPCLYAAWSDLKTMTIPNRVVLLCLALYIVLGPFLLSFEAYLWRFVPALIALLVGFVLHMLGQFGAGDAKFASVLLLFVPLKDMTTLLWLYAVITLISVATLFLIRLAAPRWAAKSGLKSFRERRVFPLGLPLALTALAYQIVALLPYLTRS
ncbi:MAG: prepilin peptidase [Pseudomonadota bacterium]